MISHNISTPVFFPTNLWGFICDLQSYIKINTEGGSEFETSSQHLWAIFKRFFSIIIWCVWNGINTHTRRNNQVFEEFWILLFLNKSKKKKKDINRLSWVSLELNSFFKRLNQSQHFFVRINFHTNFVKPRCCIC